MNTFYLRGINKQEGNFINIFPEQCDRESLVRCRPRISRSQYLACMYDSLHIDTGLPCDILQLEVDLFDMASQPLGCVCVP